MYQAKYFDEVAADILEAKKWYKQQQDGLEERFATAIEEIILKILKMPTAYGIRYKNIRIAHPKIFPYNIHFYIDEPTETVVFTGIIFNKKYNALYLKR
ncbi:MAG: hypothetical protein LBE36_13705 [Flavobacteriaceae bacterium]|jgi:hypothetical protein|nr:hypothetical protein [Flavobacteriaceae bacterium]